MTTRPPNRVCQHLRRAALLRDGAGLSDGQLLECFIRRRDEAAFEAIVRRHGSLVMGVCRRVLRHRQDAEDAFQATFLVLVRKAASIASRELLANWLYGVAYNTARKAQAAARKRQHRERQMANLPEPAAAPSDLWSDLQPLLDQALSRLPEKYRIPILLCDVQGHSRKEVARQLGWPEGSVSSRLARGRALMARWLTRQGLALSGGALGVALSERAAAVVPASVVGPTIHAAVFMTVGPGAATGALSAQVLTLTDGVLKTMMLTKLKIATVVCLTVAVVGGGAGGLLYQTHAAEGTSAAYRAASVALAAADDPAAGDKAKKEIEIQRQLRALKLLEAELTTQLRQLNVQKQIEADTKRLREQMRAFDAQAEQKRLLKSLTERLENQIQAVEEKQFREALVKAGRDALAKHEAITKAVQEIEKAVKKLRETTGNRKSEIEALREIQRAVEAMKSAAQDLNDAEELTKRLFREADRKKQP